MHKVRRENHPLQQREAYILLTSCDEKAYIISQRKIWVVVIVSSLILIELGSGIALTSEFVSID
jgi:hypothetical protein